MSKEIYEEIWKEIPDTEGKYFLSNQNRVKSIRHFKLKRTKKGLVLTFLKNTVITNLTLPNFKSI